MKDTLRAGAAMIAAFLLYTLLGHLGPTFLLAFNAFTLIVLHYSVRRGELFGAVLGTACGLLQDSFSYGVFGVAGLTKTLLGFAAGFISRKLNVVPFFRNFVFSFLLAAAEMALWIFFYSLIFGDRIVTRGALIFFQPLTTAVLGSGFFSLMRKLKGSRGET